MELNPYEPPAIYSNGATLAKKFRVCNSKLTLAEFQNFANSKVIGIIGWCVAKFSFGSLDRQIMDAPIPFLDDLCDIALAPANIRSMIEQDVDDASRLGFIEPVYILHRTTGIPCVGAAVRMRHPSANIMLQSVASSVGPRISRESNIVSMSKTDGQIKIFTTSSGHPKYKKPAGFHSQYFRGQTLSSLQHEHTKWDLVRNANLSQIATLQDIAFLVDHLVTTHFTMQVARGILQPLE